MIKLKVGNGKSKMGVYYFVFAVLVFSSCREQEAIKDMIAPEIHILSPLATDTIQSGDTLIATAQISDAGGLHEYIFRLQSATGDSVFFYLGGHNHG